MNCFRPSTVIPLLRTPLTVGKRGSSLEDGMRKVTREHDGKEENKKKVKRGRGRKQGELGMGEDEQIVRGHQEVAEVKDTLYIEHQSPDKSH